MFSKRESDKLYQVMKASLLLTMAACCTLGTAMAIPRVPRPQEHIQCAYTMDLNEISASEDDSELEALGALKQQNQLQYAATMNPNLINKGPKSKVEYLEEGEAVVNSEDDSEPEVKLQKLLQYAATMNPKLKIPGPGKQS